MILAARGLPPDLTMRARILGERDLERLGRWIARAIAGATMAELFTEP